VKPLKALFARIARNVADGEPRDEVTYADFMRAEVRPIVRECRDVATDNEVAQLIQVLRERMICLEQLATSYNFNRDLNFWAFDNTTFFDHYRNKTPTRIRCRLYFVKAIVIFGKAYGSADPYLRFSIGQEMNSLRNMPCWSTNEPEFYRAEERDIELPAAGRCQIDLLDIGDMPGSDFVGKQDAWDNMIGSTVIDLEDRWHSADLESATNMRQVPRENRPLVVVPAGGKQSVTGSMMMWLEMIDSKEAAEKKATPLQKPPPMEVEIRFVVWTCENVKLVDNGKCDAKVGIGLQCEEYTGIHPMVQKTDVHFGSLGPAVFNWRIVYPKIILPTKSCVVNIDLYDYNLIAGDAPIGSISLDVRKYVDKVGSSMDRLSITSKLAFKSPLAEDEGQNIGEVKLEMTVLPQAEATLKPAGIERSEPNENPQLMTPMEGRGWDSILPSLSFSLPSFGFYKKVLPLIIFTLLCLVGMKYTGML